MLNCICETINRLELFSLKWIIKMTDLGYNFTFIIVYSAKNLNYEFVKIFKCVCLDKNN